MKYIIFVLLVSSFIACGKKESRDQSGARGGAVNNGDVQDGDGNNTMTTIWNHTDHHLRIKKAGKQVLALTEGKCVTVSEAELNVLTIEEDDIGVGFDDVICSNMDQGETPCAAGRKVVEEAQDGDGWVLANYSGDEVCNYSLQGAN